MSSSGASLRCVAPVSSSGEQLLGVQSPGGFARGGTVFRGLQPSEARLRPEAPPSEARLRRAKRGQRSEAARRSSGGRHYKKTQKGSTRKPRGTTYFKKLPRPNTLFTATEMAHVCPPNTKHSIFIGDRIVPLLSVMSEEQLQAEIQSHGGVAHSSLTTVEITIQSTISGLRSLQILQFNTLCPFELEDFIKPAVFNDIVSGLNAFNLKMVKEINIPTAVWSTHLSSQAVKSGFLYGCCPCCVTNPFLAIQQAGAERTLKTNAVSHQIKTDLAAEVSRIDQMVNDMNKAIHFRMSPDYKWFEFYNKIGWDTPSGASVQHFGPVEPTFQDKPPAY